MKRNDKANSNEPITPEVMRSDSDFEDTLEDIRNESESIFSGLRVSLHKYKSSNKPNTKTDLQHYKDLTYTMLLSAVAFTLADIALSKREELDNGDA